MLLFRKLLFSFASITSLATYILFSQIRRHSFKKISNYSNYLADLFLLAVIPKNVVQKLLKKGLSPHFPKGAIITSAHLGNWELVALLARPITVLAKDTKLKYLTSVARVRKRFGVNVIYIDKTPTREIFTTLLVALQRGEFVGIMSDRNYGNKTRLPKGAATLAYITGAPIVPSFAIFSDGLYDIQIDAPIYAHRNGVPKDVHIKEITQRIADSFSSKISSYPDQWFNFYPVRPFRVKKQTDTRHNEV